METSERGWTLGHLATPPPGGTIGTIFDSAIILTPRFDAIEGGDVTVGIGVPPIHPHAS